MQKTGKPPPGPDVTDRDLKPVRGGDAKRFDLDEEVTATREPETTGEAPPVLDEPPTGDAYVPGNTLDEPDEPISAPPTAILGDDEDEPSETTRRDTPPPRPRTGKQEAHRPAAPPPPIRAKLFAPSPIDVESGQVVSPRRHAPLGADAYEPGDLTGSTARNLSQSFGMLTRWRNESWPVKLGLVGAIVSLCAFVFWLLFLAAR